MGYLDNTSITVDAILTVKGRELLAQGGIGAFNITQFALADDEIDYTMFNENHPNGSQYSGEAIENMPLTEAIPDETNIMRYKLVTLPEGTSVIPFISIGMSNVTLSIGATKSFTPQTHNYNGVVGGLPEPGGYRYTIADNRLFQLAEGIGPASQGGLGALTTTPSNTTAQSVTVVGNSLNLTAKSATALFGTTTALTTTLTIEGMTTSARLTIPITLTKNVTNFKTTGDSTDTTVTPSSGI